MALRLCALAQSGHPFTADNVERTLEPGRPIRLPQLLPLDAAAAVAAAAAAAPAGVTHAPPAPPAVAVAAPAVAAPPLPASPPRRAASETVPPGAVSSELAPGAVAASPLFAAIELRPTPLRPRAAAKLRVLCGAPAGGALWAGPSRGGGLMRWPDAGADAPLGVPLPASAVTPGLPDAAVMATAPPPVSSGAAPGEDADAEPAVEVLGPAAVAAANAAQASATSSGGAATCLLPDAPRGLVWSGHADGRVCSWRVEAPARGQAPGIGGGAVACWQAHKGAVSALALTSAGALWSGGKGGTLRAWHAGICLAGPPTHAAPASAAAAFAGAISGPAVADGGRQLLRRDGGKPHGEVRALLALPHRSGGHPELVWSAGATAFIIWDATTLVALRIFNPDGSAIPDVPRAEAEAAEAAANAGGGFLGRMAKAVEKRVQRANEFLETSTGGDAGAAGVLRVTALAAAPGGGGGVVAAVEDSRVAGKEMLVRYGGAAGMPEGPPLALPAPARCLLTDDVAGRVWAGLASGEVVAVDAAHGAPLRPAGAPLPAHKGGVAALAAAPGRVYSLGDDGAVRGWARGSVSTEPPSAAAQRLAAALAAGAGAYTSRAALRVFAGTWNVAEKRPDPRSLRAWLGSLGAAADVAAFGLQEIEKLGAGSVSASAARELAGMGDTLNGNASWWQSALGAALDDVAATGPGGGWEPLAARQLSGMLLLVFARKRLAPHLGAAATASAACGIMGVGGNKGGVGVRVTLFRRTLCFVNCHLAAHQGAVRKRNANVESIVAGMLFDPALSEWWRAQQRAAAPAAPPPVTSSSRGSGGGGGDDSGDEGDDVADDVAQAGPKRSAPPAGGLGDFDAFVFLGDTNYRIDLSYEEAVAAIAAGELTWLARHDQCGRERAAGRVFAGLREGPLRFAPTYKFDKGAPGALSYDSSEKRRIPAWCDRVLWADNSTGGGEEGPCATSSVLEAYESVMDVCESDHKPVRALLRLALPAADERRKRRAATLAAAGALAHAAVPPPQQLPPLAGGTAPPSPPPHAPPPPPPPQRVSQPNLIDF